MGARRAAWGLGCRPPRDARVARPPAPAIRGPLQAFNAQTLQELFGDDKDQLGEALRIFTQRTRSDLLALRNADAAHDSEAVARLLHRLKGSAGAVGAEALAQHCRAGEQSSPQQLGAVLDAMDAAFRDFERASAALSALA